jgi:hypothetical protein
LLPQVLQLVAMEDFLIWELPPQEVQSVVVVLKAETRTHLAPVPSMAEVAVLEQVVLLPPRLA